MAVPSAPPGLFHEQDGRWRKDVLLILLVAAGLRIIYFVFSSADAENRQLTLDSFSYTVLAENILDGRGFGRMYQEPGEPARWLPELCRTPGYPYLYAALTWLTGRPQAATIVLQSALSLAICLVGMRVAEKLWSRRAGLFVGVWLAVDLQGIALANLIMTESPAGLTMFFATIATGYAVLKRSPGLGVIGGVLTAAATLIRPVSMLLPVLLGVPLLAWAAWQRSRPLTLTALAIFLSGNLLQGAWVIRNGLICGEYTISCLGRFQLLGEHASQAMTRATGIPHGQTRDDLCAALGFSKAHVRRMPMSAEDRRRLLKLTIDTIMTYPKAFAVDFTIRSINVLFGPDKFALLTVGIPSINLGVLPRSWEAKYQYRATFLGWVMLLEQIAMTTVLYLLLAVVIWRLIRRRDAHPMTLVCLVFSMGMLLPSLGAPGNPRYRWPAVPLMVLAAASAVDPVCSWLSRRRGEGATASPVEISVHAD